MRALRILLITAVILGGLFIAADRIAVNMAESETADKIRTSQGLSQTPDVSIKGFPFLTQVLGKQLDEVDVSVEGVTAAADGRTVNVTEVKADLRDVKIGSDFSSAVAGRADGSARISYEDLAKAAPEGATVGYAGPERAAKGQVKVTGTPKDLLKSAGKSVGDSRLAPLLEREVTVFSSVELIDGKTVRFKAESLPGGIPLPGFDRLMRDAIDYDLTIEGVPSRITLDRVEATEGGLRFSGRAQDVAVG